MDVINQITEECFNALHQLRDLEEMPASPELVHKRLCGFIEDVKQRGRDAGVADRDVSDMQYALVALADELAIGKPDPLRGLWLMQPLQLLYFNDNNAGEGFFDRMQAVRKDPRRIGVLRVYYLCLLFGFRGRYGIGRSEVELMQLIDSVRADIDAASEYPDALSPAGEPPDEPFVRRSGKNPLFWVSLGIFALAIALFIGLRVSLDNKTDELSDRVEELTR